jgi:Domain of unknown function (DUF4105)
MSGLLAASTGVILLTAWAAGALWFRLPGSGWPATVAAILALAGGLTTLVVLWTAQAGPALMAFAAAISAMFIWWSTIQPPIAADFAPDVMRQVSGTREGERLTLKDVRSFQWRSETDVTQDWDTRSYDLAGLRSLDLFMSHWDGGEAIAHMIMSFGFTDGRYLAWSVEVRRLRGGDFSPVGDLFKSNALVIIAAEERDVIGVRTNIRGEDVRRYRLNLSQGAIRATLLEFVAQANALATRPAFYNSLTTNCTTTVVAMMRATGATVPLDWRLLVNGHLPDYAFAQEALEPGLTLAVIKARAPVSAKALKAGLTDGYSQAIRAP